jgi:hypothetical protein
MEFIEHILWWHIKPPHFLKNGISYVFLHNSLAPMEDIFLIVAQPFTN